MHCEEIRLLLGLDPGDKDFQKRRVRDGIYDLSGVEYLSEPVFWEGPGRFYDLSTEEKKQHRKDHNEKTAKLFMEFIGKYPGYALAEAYETETTFLLSRYPDKFSGVQLGSGFNYGSTSILDNCPRTILILAEND